MKVWVKGTQLPSPEMEGTTLTHPKTWTTNSGRTASGKMTGRVQYYKYKLVLKWGCLTLDEYKILKNLFEKEPHFFSVKVEVVDGTGTTEFTGYAGDLSYEKCIELDDTYYRGVTVEIVER